MADKIETAICRGCRRELRGEPFYKGGSAYHPDTGKRCPRNYYGGFVCSYSCDVRASLELERTMPGHGPRQTRPLPEVMRQINERWSDSS